MSLIEKIPPTYLNCTKSKSHNDICSKDHHNISDWTSVQKLLSDNSKDPINNCDIGSVNNKVTWTKDMPLTNPDCLKSKTHDDNYDKSNRDINNRVGNEKWKSDN